MPRTADLMYSDPAFVDILKSEVYSNLEPGMRREFLSDIKALSPDERAEFARQLKKERLSGMAEMGLDLATNPENDPEAQKMATQGLAATGVAMGVAAGLPHMLPAALTSVAPITVDIAANVLGRKVNQAVGLEEGSPTKLDKWDLLNAAIPTAVRTGQRIWQGITSPGRKALAVADKGREEINLARQKAFEKYKTDVQATDVEHNIAQAKYDSAQANLESPYGAKYDTARDQFKTKVAEGEAEAAEASRKGMADWEQHQQQLHRQYQADMSKEMRRTDLSNEAKATKYQELTDAYQESIQQHAKARSNLLAVPESIPTQDYTALYAKVPKDIPVELTKGREAAQFVIDSIDQQFPGFKDSSLYTKAKGIVDAKEPSFQEVQQLLSDVGYLKKTAEARDSRMRGLIKTLDKGIFEDVMATGEPGTALAQANKAYSKVRSRDDLADVFHGGMRERATDNAWQLSPDSIRKGFGKWLDDPYTAKNFTPQELEAIVDTVHDITHVQPLKNPPGRAPIPQEPDYSKITAKLPGPSPEPVQARIPENPSPSQADLPEPPGRPDYPKPNYKIQDWPTPTVEPPKFGKLIAGRIAGSMIGGAMAGHQMGLNNYEIALLTGAMGVAGAAAPEVISMLLVSGPRGQAVLRSVMAGRHVLGPKETAALSGAARGIYGIRSERE